MHNNMIISMIQDPIVSELESQETISILELLLNGGYMMIPILLLWMVAIYIFVERSRTLTAASRTPESFKEQIRSLVLNGDIGGALSLCSTTDTPVARMIEKGVSKIGSPLKNIEVGIENVGKLEIYRLEKNLNLMATIAGAAPMIGFLGLREQPAFSEPCFAMNSSRVIRAISSCIA